MDENTIKNLLLDIKKGQGDIKLWLNRQDKDIEILKQEIQALKNQGKYTVKQIVIALAMIIPILGYFKDMFRIYIMGH